VLDFVQPFRPGRNLGSARWEAGVQQRQVRHIIEEEAIRREAQIGAAIDPNTLSLSAQQKIAIAIRQHQRRLDQDFETRVLRAIRQRLEETILPSYEKTAADHQEIIKARKGLMSKADYNKIMSCLHPDSRKSITDEKLVEAFQIWRKLEILLLDEKESPTATLGMPRTYQEMMELKRKVSEMRRGKRATTTTTVIRR
jgi:hypothetical protein